MRIVPSYIEVIAREFWKRTGQKVEPPYDIAGAISLLLPIDIVSLSDLTLGKINRWLSDNGIQIPIDVNDRYLHGFVLIGRGTGFMFVNGTDGEDERRFTIAHEASHFIMDYKIPREKAIQKMGTSIQDVLDGTREATMEEQVDGLINGISVRSFIHLLEKEGDGSFESVEIFDVENKADMLAIELLAPHLEVIKATLNGQQKMSFSLFDQYCLDILVSKYKLPIPIAKQYSKRLAYSVTGGPSIITKLGF
jgi:hypothetical protein